MPRGPNPRLDDYGSANQMFTGGVDSFTGAMDKYAGRLKDRAVNELLGGYTPDPNDMQGSHNNLMQQLAGVGGISPVEALGLTSKAMDPMYKQMSYDKGQYGFTTDDLGNAYQFNKNTGSYDQVQESPYTNGINPKLVTMKTVTNTDSNGVTTTKHVPFNKVTGEVIDFSGPGAGYEQPDGTRVDAQGNVISTPKESGVGVKYPAVNQKDKNYADDMGGINSNLAALDKIVKDPTYKGAFGAIDEYTGKVGALFGSKDGVKQAEANALISNMLAGFGKAQMAGVLTDQDMEIIKKQIPDVGDHPSVAQEKMKFIIRMMQEKNQAYIDRMNTSNPDFLKNASTYESPDVDNDVNNPNVRSVGGVLYDKVEGGWQRRQ